LVEQVVGRSLKCHYAAAEQLPSGKMSSTANAAYGNPYGYGLIESILGLRMCGVQRGLLLQVH